MKKVENHCSKAYRKPRAFNCHLNLVMQTFRCC